jgi:hypothetical protein
MLCEHFVFVTQILVCITVQVTLKHSNREDVCYQSSMERDSMFVELVNVHFVLGPCMRNTAHSVI